MNKYADKNAARKKFFRSTTGRDRDEAREAREVRRALDGKFGNGLADYASFKADRLASGTSRTKLRTTEPEVTE